MLLVVAEGPACKGWTKAAAAWAQGYSAHALSVEEQDAARSELNQQHNNSLCRKIEVCRHRWLGYDCLSGKATHCMHNWDCAIGHGV